MIARAVAVAALSLGVLAACGDDTVTPQDDVFTAQLTGAKEVGAPQPRVTTATATASITINVARTQVAFNIAAVGLDSVISGHIHAPAPDTANAGVVVPLLAFAAPGVAQATYTGTVPLSSITAAALGTAAPLDSLVKLIRAGRAYVNLHSVRYPGGEIRGQLQ